MGEQMAISEQWSGARRLLETATPPAWDLATLRGRIVELVAPTGGETPWLLELLAAAHRVGEPTAWILPDHPEAAPPLPEELAAAGADPEATIWIHAPSARERLRACERLVASGAFGVVIVEEVHQVPLRSQGRLATQVREHATTVLWVGRRLEGDGAVGLGSLVSLRLYVTGELHPEEGVWYGTLHALKDKRHGPGWRVRRRWPPPPGLP